MTDGEGIRFLQWCLPRLGLRWPGFRKVRRQVQRRLARRLAILGLPDLAAYQCYLEAHPPEWRELDALCWISISRFYRDKGIFQYLEREALPAVASLAARRGDATLRCWSIGCASGEEPYTLAILWRLRMARRFLPLGCWILATDVDAEAIRRAERGCYRASGVRELPGEWVATAFVHQADEFCVRLEYRELVKFRLEDVRRAQPDERFHLVLCRNVVFTYFDETTQREALVRIADRLVAGGMLVVGATEILPQGAWGLAPVNRAVYRKEDGCERS